MQSKILSPTFIVLILNFIFISSSNGQTNENILDSKSTTEQKLTRNLKFLELQWKSNKSKSYKNEQVINRRPVKLSKNDYYIELLLIVDKRLRKKYNNDDSAILNRMKDIVSFVDILYNQFGIRVILLDVIIWRENPIKVTRNGTETLLNLLSYGDIMKRTITSNSVWKRVDTLHLMTGNQLQGELVATGVFDSICASISGGIEVEDTQKELTALLLAHEIGHNLGLSDDNKDCNCGDGLLCIMRPSSPNSITSGLGWSDCTYERLKTKQETFEKCLVIGSSPTKAGVCGNGIIEGDEDCDCGAIEDCISTCCNPYNCKFKSGAVCDSGPCCFECQLAGPDKICRGNNGNDCDLIEYCRGDSEFCPEDIFKADGTTCNDSEGVCYKRVCQSHHSQCRMLLGESAFSASKQCYNFVNIVRKEKTNSKKIKVTGSNALCSNLICCKTFEKETSNKSYFLDMVEILNQCKKLSVYLDVQISEQLVTEGSECGTNSYCLEEKCVERKQIPCNGLCKDYEACSDQRKCHCITNECRKMKSLTESNTEFVFSLDRTSVLLLNGSYIKEFSKSKNRSNSVILTGKIVLSLTLFFICSLVVLSFFLRSKKQGALTNSDTDRL